MGKVIISEENLTNIANAIRAKNGETTTYKPSEMAAAIENLNGSFSDNVNISLQATGGSSSAPIYVSYIQTYKDSYNNIALKGGNYKYTSSTTKTLSVAKGSYIHVFWTGTTTQSLVVNNYSGVSCYGSGKEYVFEVKNTGSINVSVTQDSGGGSND